MKPIGFIGVGFMGKPMARNLLRGGYTLIAHDVNRGGVQELVADGAREAFSPKEVAKAAEIIFTSLPSDQAVEEVVLGQNGIIEGVASESIVVETSTISPTTARNVAKKLALKGVEMLDAPLSGGVVGAEKATLSIMVGGKAEIFERVLPLLQKLGKNITHIGGQGTGQIAKAANQIIVALSIDAVAEALIFAKKAGADPAKVRKALLGGFAQSRVLEEHGQRMLDRNFEPGGKMRFHQKDIGIVLAIARELGIYLPGTSMMMDLWNAMTAQGMLDWDHSALVKVLEQMSNVEVRPG
ncbi:MAG: 2-hydroxy-3-oxopropionate reductase [Deltaproteobacteria bacterium]|nr:2-hydroxy-3-oxopropionate reductase [Deltaproteobacteria bacterium]